MDKQHIKKQSPVTSEVVEVNLVQLAKYFYTHRILLAIAAVLAPALIGLWTFFIKKPVYQSQVAVNVNIESSTSDYEEKRLYYYLMQQDAMNKLNWAEEFFYSKKFKSALIDEVEGRTQYIDKYPKMDTYKKNILSYFFGGNTEALSVYAKADRLSSHLSLATHLEKNKLTITVRTPSPSASMMLTDIVAHLLVELNHKKLLERVKNIISFLENQTHELRGDLKQLETDLVHLQEKYGIVSSEAVSYHINSIDAQRMQDVANLRQIQRANKSLIKEVRRELIKAKKHLAEGKNSSYLYLAQLEKRLELLKYQQVLSKNSREPSSKKTNYYKEKISLTQQKMERAVAPSHSSLKHVTQSPLQSVKNLEKYLNELELEQKKVLGQIKAHQQEEIRHKSHLGKMPAALQSIAELQRNIKMTEKLYSEMNIRLQETRVREAGRDNDMSILTRSEMPTSADGMGIVKKMILSLFTGSILMMLVLLLRFVLIPTIRDVFDLEKYGLKVIGSISWYRANEGGLLGINKRPPLVIDSDPQSYEANSLYYAQFKLEKELGLIEAKDQKMGKILSFCSANSNEGKTFCAANLAFSLAKSQYKVLVVDADFSKPDVLDYFELQQQEETLRSIEYSNEELNFRVNAVNSNLDIMAAQEGNEMYADVLQSASFRELMNELRYDYDIIILDNPPMNGHMSSLLVSQYSDSTVMVVNQRSTLSQDVYKHYKNLAENVDYPVLSILNFVYDDIKSARRNYDKRRAA